MTDLQRDIGRHDAEIAALQADLNELKRDMKTILETLSEARGGWKTVLMVGGMAGAVGALAAKILPFISLR